MTTQFDPYREWLGLDVGTERPSHYQLLGLAEFESDTAAIAAAADVRMKEVRQYQTGPRGRFTQKILNELASAKLCLLDARTKKTYDAFLQGQRAACVVAAPIMSLATSYLAEPPIAPPPTASPPTVAPPPVTSPKAPPPAKYSERSTQEAASDEQPSTWPWLGLVLVVTLLGGTLVVAGVVYSKLGRENAIVAPPVDEEPPPPPPPGRRDTPLSDEIVISQEGNGDLNFPIAAAELVGGLERTEQAGATALAGFDAPEAVARWRFKVVRPAIFKVQIIYTANKAEGSQWKFALQNDDKSRDVENGATTDEFFWKVTTSGEQTLELIADHLSPGSMLELQSLRFLRQDAGRVK